MLTPAALSFVTDLGDTSATSGDAAPAAAPVTLAPMPTPAPATAELGPVIVHADGSTTVTESNSNYANAQASIVAVRPAPGNPGHFVMDLSNGATVLLADFIGQGSSTRAEIRASDGQLTGDGPIVDANAVKLFAAVGVTVPGMPAPIVAITPAAPTPAPVLLAPSVPTPATYLPGPSIPARLPSPDLPYGMPPYAVPVVAMPMASAPSLPMPAPGDQLNVLRQADDNSGTLPSFGPGAAGTNVPAAPAAAAPSKSHWIGFALLLLLVLMLVYHVASHRS